MEKAFDSLTTPLGLTSVLIIWGVRDNSKSIFVITEACVITFSSNLRWTERHACQKSDLDLCEARIVKFP